MRYPEGGGGPAEGRARREKLRLQAAHMFEQGITPVRVARLLRVSTKSVYQWRRRWRGGGPVAPASKGPGGAGGPLDEGAPALPPAGVEPGPAADGRWGGPRGD